MLLTHPTIQAILSISFTISGVLFAQNWHWYEKYFDLFDSCALWRFVQLCF
jgi:hypothetical protein